MCASRRSTVSLPMRCSVSRCALWGSAFDPCRGEQPTQKCASADTVSAHSQGTWSVHTVSRHSQCAQSADTVSAHSRGTWSAHEFLRVIRLTARLTLRPRVGVLVSYPTLNPKHILNSQPSCEVSQLACEPPGPIVETGPCGGYGTNTHKLCRKDV